MKTFNCSEILDRVKSALKLNSDTELANHLGIKKATLSNWRTRNSLDWPLLFSFCEHTNLHQIIYGYDDSSAEPLKMTTANHTDALIDHLDKKIIAKDHEMGLLHEDIGRLKARIELLERELEQARNFSTVVNANTQLLAPAAIESAP